MFPGIHDDEYSVKRQRFLGIVKVGSVGVGIICVLWMPYFFYGRMLEGSIFPGHFTIKLQNKDLLKGGEYIVGGKGKGHANAYGEQQSLWKNFHFSHFVFPFPLRHPLYRMIPVIDYDGKKAFLGAKITDPDNMEYVKFKMGVHDQSYSLPPSLSLLEDQKLFIIPIFKKHILSHSKEEILKDLFSKNLRIPSMTNPLNWPSLLKVPYKNLVYNLFILKMRKDLFPKKTKKISFHSEKKMGVIHLSPSEDEDDYRRYEDIILYFFKGGTFYTIDLRVKKGASRAQVYKRRIFKDVRYEKSTERALASLYKEHKSLSYRKKIDQEGLTYLLASWSHRIEHRDFLREIIHFLEKGEGNRDSLKTLYKYAFKRYGSDFSPKKFK